MSRRRTATPDEDEEAHEHHQEQEDEESTRKRRRTNENKSKASSAAGTNGKAAGGNASESEGEEFTDDEDAVRAALRGWTVDSFTDKPVQATKAVLQQLKKMQEQLQGQIALMARSISRITDVAAALEDCRGGLSTKSRSTASAVKGNGEIRGKADARSDNGDDDDAEEGGENHEDKVSPMRDDAEEKRNEETAVSLEDKVKSIIDEIKVLDCRIKAVGGISAQLQQDQQMVNVPGEFKRRFEQELGDYREASDRTKYKNSKYYQEFKQTVWDIRHEDACPPISTFLEKGPDDPESDDDDIEIGGTTQDFKCPLTLLPFQDAVSSTKCVHSFSAEAIRNHIKSHRGRSAKCPVAGCDKMLSLGDIKPNPTLQRKSDQVKARLQRRREEEEDAEAEDAELIE